MPNSVQLCHAARGLNQYTWHLGSYLQTFVDKVKGEYELHG